jgi:hypothetical protein
MPHARPAVRRNITTRAALSFGSKINNTPPAQRNATTKVDRADQLEP